MRLQLRIALITGALVMAFAPAAMAAGQPEGDPPYGANAQGNGPIYAPEDPPTPGPKAGLPEQAKAYGRYCKGESKKHVKGEKGTPFSNCVKNMRELADHPNMSNSRACRDQTRKHVKGEKGTAFSRCVKAAAKLRHDENEQETEAGTETVS
jgi:hypothetical protein